MNYEDNLLLPEKKQLCSKRQALYKLADYLARRDHSEKELIEKLSRKFTINDIDWALTEAKKQNWLLDPMELAEKVTEQLHDKLKGHHYITQYLKTKGLPKVDVNPEREREKIRLWIEKQEILQVEDQKSKEKLFRQLKSRGFSPQLIFEYIF